MNVRIVPLLVALVAASPVHAQTGAVLRVVRSTPSDGAEPGATIAVTFDRPVAGSLDRMVDPTRLLSVVPAVPGKIEWRDAVTIRLVPSAPLTAGQRYTVTVSNDFRAMDGSALPAPHSYSFRAKGATLLSGSPAGPYRTGEFLRPDQKFELVYSAPVDLARLTALAYLEFNAACASPRIVHLTALSQRRPTSHRGSEGPAGGLDTLRREVQLVPVARLPRGCRGDLVVPSDMADETSPTRLPLSTYGDFRADTLVCREGSSDCPTGPLVLAFTTPVRGGDVLRRVKLYPETKFVIRDTSGEATRWVLEAKLKPRTTYAAIVDTALRDIFGQKLVGNPALGARTTGFAPAVNYPYGRLLVERVGFRTLAVQHVNVDTLLVTIVPVPPQAEAGMLARLAWGGDSVWNELARNATVQRIPVRAPLDRAMITGVRLPALNAMSPGAPTLLAVRIAAANATSTFSKVTNGMSTGGPTALVQLTDLGVHAKVGVNDAAVWVTGVSDGSVKRDAEVTLHDAKGRVLATARTDAEGVARFANWATTPPDTAQESDWRSRSFEGYVSVKVGPDRAITAISDYDPDLSPWRFNVSSAWGDDRFPIAGAAFTERGIYRPGERVYAKAIVRTGALGALRAAAPNDSIRWRFHDRDEGMLREVTTSLSAFGTADQSVALPRNAAIGDYRLGIEMKRAGKWRSIAHARYRVAEYRPPEFLVDMIEDRTPRLAGDRLTAHVSARYLFGAPMGRAAVSWTARRTPVWAWDLNIPGMDGWEIGESGNWWDDYEEEKVDEFASRIDTLDARGERTWALVAPAPVKGRAASVTLEATVTDVNRQTVSARTSTVVHPADFYVAAKQGGTDWFWRAGAPQSVQLVAVRPGGQRVPGVRVEGIVERREWHRVRRERDGISETVGEYVTDTVARCTVTTSAAPVPCAFTPPSGGEYTVSFRATDAKGRPAITSFHRWTAGEGYVPWNDETQFKMDVVPNRTRYAVGDTATIMFASPFTNAEAWITVEREGLIRHQRLRITSGSTTIRLPITEAFAPNVFVGIVVARGRSAPPGSLDDAGRPTIRVGYTQLTVTPEVKRLTVAVAPDQPVYRPGDTARVRLQVRDRQRRGMRSEVTLWAVDEGVLSLTGYRTPDPLALLYRARGLGMRLASNMTSVAPQVPEGEKGRREAGGGGGADGGDILRSKFQTTAFFLGSVVTDASGNAVISQKLPDNITTFRVMAVAVTAGDRYGSGQSPMLVTRPLLARQALPRFLRPGDDFTAGAVINRRDGSAADVAVTAAATGVTLRGEPQQRVTLAAMKGTEVRFPFQALRADSATFRFDVADDRNADAVRVGIPMRPDHRPVAHTVAGMLRDTATLELPLPAGIDLDRSRVSVSVGVSPLAAIKGMAQALEVYPYQCSEQVVSAAVPLVALYRAERAGAKGLLAGDPRASLTRAVDILSSRQRTDGGIGYWSRTDWTTPWLSAYAGMVMLDARDQGIAVDTVVLSRLAGYLTTELRREQRIRGFHPVGEWYVNKDVELADRVAAVDLMSRFGRPVIEAENDLLRTAAQLSLEDRARLAEVFARRGQTGPARALMQSVWSGVRVVGRRAELTDTLRKHFYFESRIRPLARILTATLAVAPDHPLVGPLAEGITVRTNARKEWYWNTQDYASAVTALADLDRRTRARGDRALAIRSADREVLQWAAGPAGAPRDSTVSLRAVVGAGGAPESVKLALRAGAGDGALFYYVTLTEIPLAPPVRVLDNGIQVERWYEHVTAATPISGAVEGELVRVRLRVTVPATRYFLVLDDALPAGLEAVDLSLRTAADLPGPGKAARDENESDEGDEAYGEDGCDCDGAWYGRWDSGWWSPFDHTEIRDDRVVYSAATLWKGTYMVSYLARATTPGTFLRPPAHAEEMYDPAVNGRSDGGTFVVTKKK